MVVTTDVFWDCDCDDDYIHDRGQTECEKCGANRDFAPDSIIDEVILMLLKEKMEKL